MPAFPLASPLARHMPPSTRWEEPEELRGSGWWLWGVMEAHQASWFQPVASGKSSRDRTTSKGDFPMETMALCPSHHTRTHTCPVARTHSRTYTHVPLTSPSLGRKEKDSHDTSCGFHLCLHYTSSIGLSPSQDLSQARDSGDSERLSGASLPLSLNPLTHVSTATCPLSTAKPNGVEIPGY